MKLSTKAVWALLSVSAIWGLTFPLIHVALQFISPAFFVFVRFSLAALFFLPLIIGYSLSQHKKTLQAGLIIGVLSGLSYILQTKGLSTIAASRSAFITGANVVLVPLFMPFFNLGKIRLLDFICAAFCLLGIYILTGADLHHLVMGDAWTFLAAVCYALAILFIQKYSQELEKEVNLIAFYQIFFTIPLALAMSGKFTWPVLFNPHVIAAILFCALVATCVVFYLQLNYQKHTTATKAALIYALEPVFAVFFAYFIEGEHPVFFTLLGGAIIMGSILLSDFKFSSK